MTVKREIVVRMRSQMQDIPLNGTPSQEQQGENRMEDTVAVHHEMVHHQNAETSGTASTPEVTVFHVPTDWTDGAELLEAAITPSSNSFAAVATQSYPVLTYSKRSPTGGAATVIARDTAATGLGGYTGYFRKVFDYVATGPTRVVGPGENMTFSELKGGATGIHTMMAFGTDIVLRER